MDFKYVIYLLLLIIIGGSVYKRLSPAKNLRTLTEVQLLQKLKQAGKFLLIDVREAHEFRSGHISGAVNIPLSMVHQRLKDIPKDKKLILYCQSGMRSKQFAKVLQKKNYKDIYHLSGGISSWSGKVKK
ncbi:rhodanese-like domain-containing protein [Bacillus glycinifermentans]|uniref:rhodanese-like domain-containing protein n=1 Tax=Bacillus glycinifermentans TaxID=1664069 RepID=UPI001FF69055|nr:rhodanese-like domain-containing protein [Bacillus glycinifermentans]UOY89993.1 rhodanese-like domain-containing protein [Bacillus glycinifermentans]